MTAKGTATTNPNVTPMTTARTFSSVARPMM